MPADYSSLPGLKTDFPSDRLLRITMSNGPMNTLDFEMHHALAEVWRTIDADPDVNAVVLTGEGKTFSAGGNYELLREQLDDFEIRTRLWKDGRNLMQNIIDCSKPVVSAINGPAAGGALAAALLSDITVVGKTAKLVEGNTRFGIAACDGGVLIWPLLCGMAKAKYYLLTSDSFTGEEAEKMGLVTMSVDDDKVVETAMGIAEKLVKAPPSAIRWTKLTLNLWLKSTWPAFEASLAYGFAGFGGPEAREGLAALQERRRPIYDPRSYV
jgi:enoyl-CoA hydratase